MIKKLMMLCFAAIAMVGVQAATETVNGVKWTYFVERGRATVGGSGQSPSTAVSTSISGAITIPETLGGYPVECIGYNAFYGCANLTSVKIPNRVWGFGDRAFKGCKGLADSDGFVIVNGNLYDYFGENKNVIIPDGVHCIRKEAFADCSFIVDITVPNSVKSISQNAFSGCSGLENVTIPDSVEKVDSDAFFRCASLTNVYCGAETIEYGAFEECSNLENITFSGKLKNIGPFALGSCLRLSQLTIPSGVTNIASSALYWCTNLVSVVVENGNMHYSVVDRILYAEDGQYLVWCPSDKTRVVIPDGVTCIGDHAFCGCVNLKSIFIPDSVSTIVPWNEEWYKYNNSWDNFSVWNDDMQVYNMRGPSKVSVGIETRNLDGDDFRSSVEFCVNGMPHDCIYSDDWSIYFNEVVGVGRHQVSVSCYDGDIGDYLVVYMRTDGFRAFSGCSNIREVRIPAHWDVPISELMPDAVKYYSFKNAVIELSYETCYYSGLPKCPQVRKVVASGIEYQEGVDFEVYYENNVAKGQGVVVLRQKDPYSSTEIRKNFTILPIPLEHLMISEFIDVVYSGSPYTPSPVITDVERGVTLVEGVDYTLSYSNNKNAGVATVSVTGKGDYSGTATRNFTIAKATYDMSRVRWTYSAPFTYDGLSHTVTLTGLPSGVTVASYSNNSMTAAGNYTATVSLNYDSANYQLITVEGCSWSIVKAEVVPPILAVKPYTGSAQTAAVPSSQLYRVVQNIPQTNPGTYSVMLELIDPTNYRWADSESTLYTVPFTIKSKEESELEDVFGDLPAEVEPGEDDGWTVRLTGDIDGPVEIPGNLGFVTLDLYGYNITGIDGEPAIRITAGDGSGAATRLSLVTGGGDSLVQGGAGSSAIIVDEGVDGVIIDIGAGVTVRAGCDDVPAVSGGEVNDVEGGIVKVKVPVPVIPDLEYTGKSQKPSLQDTDVYVVVMSSGVNPGSYPVMLTLASPGLYEWVPRDGAVIDNAVVSFMFTILDPPPAIDIEGGMTQGEANGASVSAVYDGRGHGISVNVVNPPVGASVRYALSAAGPYTATRPLFTNVIHAVETWYEISAEGFGSVTGMATVTVSPKPLSMTMVSSRRLKEDDDGDVVPVLGFSDVAPCEITVDDWDFVSWEPRASGGGFATVRGKGNYAGTLAIDVPNEMMVVFDAVYGSSDDVRTVTTQIPGRPYALPPTAPVYRGHDFLGWFTERDGGEEVTSARTVSLSDPDVVYAHWRVRTYKVSFDLNGGTGDAMEFDATYGSAFGSLPSADKPGYLFDGWWKTPDFRNGTQVSEGDACPTADTTLYAKWLRRALWYDDAIFHLESAAVYDGYLIDVSAGDIVAGTVKVKAGKPNKKTGISKLTVTIAVAGEKKVTVKGETFDGSLNATAKDGRELDILLGESALTGTFGGYVIDGARNIFSAKDADSKLKAAQTLKSWQGVYMLAWEEAGGWNGLSLSVGSKGKTKVSGALADGTKVSSTTQLLVGERESAVAVSWTKKKASVAFLVWFREDGAVECSNLGDDTFAMIANIRSGAYLSEGSVFCMDPSSVTALIPGAFADILPDGLPVRMKGNKFDIDKGGKVKLLKDKSGLDKSKAGTNPSALKLSYKIKDGSFKGSFYVYTLIDGKFKKQKANVTGVLINGIGYGTATIKKIGSWSVTIK